MLQETGAIESSKPWFRRYGGEYVRPFLAQRYTCALRNDDALFVNLMKSVGLPYREFKHHKLINVLNEVVESCHICYSLAFKATEDHDPHIYSRLAHYTRTLYQRVVPSMSDFYIYLQKL